MLNKPVLLQYCSTRESFQIGIIPDYYLFFTVSAHQPKLSHLPYTEVGSNTAGVYLLRLHNPPMSVDKTGFGLMLYNRANFYRFEKTSSYWSVKRISVFLCFSLVNQRHTSDITVYNLTVYQKHCVGCA